MSDKRKHIMFISSWIPSDMDPFLGDFVIRHAESSSLLNDVSFLCVCSSESKRETRYFVKNNVSYTFVYYQKKGKLTWLFRKIRVLKLYSKAIEDIHKKKKIEIIHANITYPIGLVSLFAKRTYGIPYVISEHWTGYLRNGMRANLSLVRKFVTKKILKKASCVMPVSQDLGDSMLSRGLIGRYRVVGNVVDTKLFNYDFTPPFPFRMVHVSSLFDEQKNITGLLKGFKHALEEVPDMRLEIVGSANVQTARVLAKKIGVPDQSILFHEALSHKELSSLLRKSHAFILFSNYENLPCVIIEAMACGLPVISTDIGGVKELVDSKRGILIPKKDRKKLVNAIFHIHDRYDKYDRKEISAYATTEFSRESIARKFDFVYKGLVSKGPVG